MFFFAILSPHVRDSGIREIFPCGILNPGNYCLWNLESAWKMLLAESRILGFGVRDTVKEPNTIHNCNQESRNRQF